MFFICELVFELLVCLHILYATYNIRFRYRFRDLMHVFLVASLFLANNCPVFV